MKIIDFPGNTRTCNFSYHKVKDGPNYFVCYYKGASRLLYEPLNAWRTLESAKHTETGKALKEWCLEMLGEPEVAAAKEEPVKKPNPREESIRKWGNQDPNNPEMAWRPNKEYLQAWADYSDAQSKRLSGSNEEPVKKPAPTWGSYDPSKSEHAWHYEEGPSDNTRMVI